ncbi:MAG: tRNA (adenosine(37)-N6)-threonylcarbamoyltransferase complex ATPase subunit type 1 TsaE [Patescibacteria group bacterium]|jgi:tRNA threonylcarbamoyladenosine biosynthesis protein TsaE
MKIITGSEKETFVLASELAKKANGGEVYSLSGDLGAGKTVFIRGFCAGLGIKKGVASPTFVLMKIYPVKKNKTIKQICHIDAYRLKTKRDLEAIGAQDYFGRADTICFIEWPEMVKNFYKRLIQIKILAKSEEKRIIEIKK